VKWEDVGGLEDVKKAILDTVQVLRLLLLLPV
jgi:SpoVK/Ycf46/Vps4 family AAA+-type ATPase